MVDASAFAVALTQRNRARTQCESGIQANVGLVRPPGLLKQSDAHRSGIADSIAALTQPLGLLARMAEEMTVIYNGLFYTRWCLLPAPEYRLCSVIILCTVV